MKIIRKFIQIGFFVQGILWKMCIKSFRRSLIWCLTGLYVTLS
jgi:hypothetical protein